MSVRFSEFYDAQRPTLDPREVAKLEQAAQVHGYRGASRKKHNGVVPIQPTDRHLLTFYHKQAAAAPPALPVKVVAHVPSGNRLVAVLSGGDLYVLGMANYNGAVQ